MAEFNADAYFRRAAEQAQSTPGLTPEELAVEPPAAPQLDPAQVEAIRQAPTTAEKVQRAREAGVPESEIAKALRQEGPVPHVTAEVPAPTRQDASLLKADAKQSQVDAAYQDKVKGLASWAQQRDALATGHYSEPGTGKPIDLPPSRETLQFRDMARRYNESWIGKTGTLPSNLDGALVNLGAQMASEGSRLAGGAGSLLFNARAANALRKVPEDVQAAYSRLQAGEATAKDRARLGEVASEYNPGVTYMDLLTSAQEDLRRAQGVTGVADLSSIVYRGKVQGLSDEIRANAQDSMELLHEASRQYGNGKVGPAAQNLVVALADLVVGGGSAVLNNKQAVLEYTAGSLAPELLSYATGVGEAALVGNIGLGLDNYRQGLENYAKDHNGALPSKEDQYWMASTAITSGLLETLSASSIYRAAHPGREAAKAGVKASAKRTVAKAAEAGAEESVTEGLQTYLEGQASNRPASAMDIYESAVIGGAAGSTAAGGLHSTAELAGATEEQRNRQQQTAEQRKVDQAQFQEAVKTGDVSAFTDRQAPTYDPAKAAQALASRAQQQDLTPEERQTHQESLYSLVQQAEQDQKDAQELLDSYGPQALAANKRKLRRQEELLAQAETDSQRAEAEANIAALQEHIDRTQAMSQEDMATLQERATLTQERFQAAQQVYAQDTADLLSSTADVQDLKTQAGLTGEAANTEATSQLATLAMASPEILTGGEAQTLADSEGLNENQRQYLRSFARTETEQEAVRSLGRTQSAIVDGADGYRGIRDYRTLVSGAVASGDMTAAQEYANDLQSFAQDHSAKARALSAAMAQYKQTGQPVQVVRGTEPGSWGISKEKLSRRALKDNGGLRVDAKTFKLAQAVRAEAKALNAASAEINALLKASQPEVTQASNQSKEAPTTATTEPAPQPKAPVESPTTADVPVQPQTPVAEDLSPVEPTVTPETAPAREPGMLAALQETVDGPITAANYREANLVAAWFTQSAGKDTDRTYKPLVAVKDFLAQLRARTDLAGEFLPEGTAPHAVLGNFLQVAGRWTDRIQALLPPVDPKYRYTNLVNFLRDEQGALPENVKTALAYAAYSYVTEQGTGDWFNNDDQIRELLGEPDHYRVTDADRATFGDAGTRANVIINSLGQRTAAALGLKAKADAPASAQAKLEVALGGYALALLQDLGLTERHNLEDPRLKGDGPTTFVRLARDWQAPGKPLHPEARAIAESVWGSQGYLDKLFGAEPALKEPSLTPPGFTDTTTKGTSSRVPKTMTRIQQVQNNRPWRVRTQLNWLWRDLDRDLQEQIAGVEDAGSAHKTQRKGVEGKNDSLRREIDYLERFETDTLQGDYDTEFYFPSSIWVNQRAGVATTTVNPQASKVHRHLLGMSAWRGEVSLDPTSTEHRLFLQNVAIGLGIPADKQLQETTLAELKDKVRQAPFRLAIDLIKRQQQYEELTRDGQETIAKAVQAAGEGMQSLDALHAYARMELAREKGQDSFDADMFMMEVDGVTNGPMLTLLQLGAAKDGQTLFKFLNKGGMFEQGSPHQNFVQYKAQPGADDLYETATSKAISILQKGIRKDPVKAAVLKAIEYFKGGQLFDQDSGRATSKGRRIIKTPLTGMMFGQAPKAGVGSMFDELVGDVYNAVSKINRSEDAPAEKTAALQQWAAQVNMLIGNPRLHTPANPGLEWALDFEFSPAQLDAMRLAFTGTKKDAEGTLGHAVERAMNSLFASFLARRTVLNQAAQVSSQLYSTLFEHLKAKRLAERVKDGTIPARDGKALQDLSAADIRAIEQQLAPLRPTAFSALAKQDNDRGAGIFLPKEGRGLDGSNPAYRQELKFGQPVPDNTGERKVKSWKTTAYQRKLEDPGVRSLILMIHSADSAISAQAYEKLAALNIHDANGLNIANVLKGARNLNSATYRTMLDYSVPLEIRDTLLRTVQGLEAMQETIAADPELQDALTATINAIQLTEADTEAMKTAGLDPLGYVLQQATEAAYRAELTKLEAMGQMQAVDQYAQEGGQFKVTEALREEARQRHAERQQEAEAALAQVKPLTQAIAQSLAATGTITETPDILALPEATVRNLAEILRREDRVPPALIPEMKQFEYALHRGATVAEALAPLGTVPAADLVALLEQYHDPQRITPWGELGTPVVEPDPALTQFLENTPDLTSGKLIDFLAQYYRRQGTDLSPENRFRLGLLAALRKTVGDNLSVRYITRDTPADPMLQGHVSRARGWYEQTAGNEHIGIKSPDYVHSMVQPELLLHELVHKATSAIIDREQGKDSEAGQLVQDLEGLLTQTQLWLQGQADEALARKFAPALTNLHEFVAWGLTHRPFQQEVLAHIGVTENRSGHRLLTAMQAFIRKLTGLLFGAKATAQQETGLGYLIGRSAGLFMAAAETHTRQARARTLGMESPDAFSEVETYTSEQLFDALGAVQNEALDPDHAAHLKEVLQSLVQQLHGPYGAYRVQVNERAHYGSEDTFIAALLGRMPFASELLGQPIRVTEQEAFVLEQVEATVRTAMADTTRTTSAAYRELRKLYQETKARLKPADLFDGDWNQATPDERRQAEALYELVFRPKANTDGTSDYLARFAAMGMAYRPLRDKLAVPTVQSVPSLRGMKLGEALKALFKQLLETLNGRLTNTFAGQRADQKLEVLLDQLVGIEARRRATVIRAKERSQALNGSLKKLAEGVRAQADKFGKAPFFRESSNGFLKGFGVLTSAIAGDRVDAMVRDIEAARDAHHKGRQGIIRDIITEIRGANDTNLTGHEALRVANHNEQTRKHIIDRTAQAVLGSFADGGSYLTEEDKAAITRIALRTDMAALLDHFSEEELLTLVRSPRDLQKAIKAYEARLLQSGAPRHYWLRGAKDLGYFMATNISRNDNLMLNAHNLARLAGTGREALIDEAGAQQVETILDPLISLYALQHSPSQDRARFAQVMARETARGKESGVAMVLQLHRHMKQQALAQLFDGQPAHFMKGYTKEIYNHRKAVLTASGQEAVNLERMGARKGPALGRDPADPDQATKHLFTIDDGGARPWVTGTLSYTGSRARGTKAHGKLVTPNGYPALNNQSTLAELRTNKRAAIDRMFQANPTYDPAAQQPPRLVPVLNNSGQVVNYRYMMSAQVKDTLLERNNRMEDVLGAMAGNIVDKVSSKNQNRQVIRALYEQFQAEWKTRPNAYIEVSEHSPDPEIRNTYRMLPEETKRVIREVWGRNAVMVRKDLYTLHFGYRKFSLVEMFGKDADERNKVEDAAVSVLEGLLGDKAMLRVRQTEDMWQALVTEVKDFWVIKNLFTLLGNVSSNVSELMWLGVPAKAIVRDHRVALEGVLAYQRDHNELTELRMKRDIGHLPAPLAEVEARIVELEDALARNPVKKLVDAGLFQTIVEDIDTHTDRFSYKSRLARWIDDKTAQVPEGLRDTAKALYMAHDTPLYKLLYQGTHLSDFIARYTLVQHLMNRPDNPLSEAEAMQRAVEAFVNYDIPTNKFIQYMNDMGLIMFTKYYLRIQKVLIQLYRDNPGRSLLMLTFSHFFNSISTLMDAGFWHRLDNIASSGALEYPSAVGEALPIKAVTSITGS